MEEAPFTVLDYYIIVTLRHWTWRMGKEEKPYGYDKAIIFSVSNISYTLNKRLSFPDSLSTTAVLVVTEHQEQLMNY